MARLTSPPPPGDTNSKDGEAGDYPFELKVVQKDGMTCAWCPWYRLVAEVSLNSGGQILCY